MDLTIPIITAAASLYAIVWIGTARHLYATHPYPPLPRPENARLVAGYLALALVWPLILLYVLVTTSNNPKGWR